MGRVALEPPFAESQSAIELMECVLARKKILANSAYKKTANLIKDKRLKPNHSLFFSDFHNLRHLGNNHRYKHHDTACDFPAG